MRSIILILLMGIFYGGFAQQGSEKPVWVDMVSKVKIRENTGLPDFLKFKAEHRMDVGASMGFLRNALKMRPEDALFLKKSEKDNLGWTHYRYGQTYKNIPVEFAHYYVHSIDGKVVSVNGHFIPVSGNAVPVMTGDYARDIAITATGGQKFLWEIPGEEQLLKMETGNANASWYPQGELVFAPKNTEFKAEEYRLAWKFDIYAAEPLYRANIYVDAVSGDILFENSKIHTADSAGTAETKYSGTQAIVADFTGTTFRLRETGRGGGVETFNMNTGTNYSAATDFTDGDNYWDNVNAQVDEAAGDGHWGAEMTWDYYWFNHGRNSFNGNGAVMRSYIHYGTNFGNAFWDGQRMTYGDGSAGNRPFCTLDVSGHEFSHGVIQHTADLIYQNEPGALNESFADIFGACIEFYAKPAQANWLIGEDLGVIRSMSDPKQYNSPDTYFGSFWITGAFDNGGVHFNSGVQNHWFYLLSVGGSGTNDNGDAYTVQGISVDSAEVIAYRNLSVYLGASSQYADARFYAIESASDIFGECSQQMISTMNAWHAVGVGTPFGPLESDFFVDETGFCTAPALVNFTNQSVGGLTFFWDFDDGTFSTAVNPPHNYNFFGTYQPKLIAYGCSTLVDTFVLPTQIIVDQGQPCTVNMPLSGTTAVAQGCDGRLLDSGGNGDYLPNVTSSITISPPNASTIELTFLSFDYVMGGDFVAIYDGPDANAPLIGYFNGNTLPNGGVITSTGGSLHLMERTNGAVEKAGFEALWSCLVSSEDPMDMTRVEVYPNPAEDAFALRVSYSDGAEDFRILVRDAFGREILSRNVTISGTWQEDFSAAQWARGMYFVEVIAGDNRMVKKVLLQ